IPLPQNGKIPQAPKPSRTWESNNEDADVPEPAQPKMTDLKMCQSKNTVEDIITDDVQAPPLVQERPVPHRKPAAPVTATPGTNAEIESFVPAHALKKVLPVAGVEAPPSSQPVPAQPVPPLSKPALCSPSPSRSSPDDDETPLPPSTQPRRPLPSPSESPCIPSLPIVHDPGFTPSPSDFETISVEEQLHISCLHPVSQEELDAEDDLAFHKEIMAELEAKAKTKTKKGKGKERDVNGSFKLGPIPNEVKERLYAIHADFERQVEELTAEIGKSPHLLFSLREEKAQ
ncbi:hypothetical protein DXG01_010901, partial [Tephrocybe rancida]